MASNFEYQQVPESSSGVLRGQWGKSVSWAYPLLLLAITALVMMWVTAPPLLAGGELLRHKDARGNAESRLILHISDPHIDPLFNPFMSMAGKVCHSCDLSSKVHGDQAFCPSDISYSNTSDEELNRKRGYAFGSISFAR